MKHIGSFEQLNSMVSDFKSGRGKVISNCYMLPDSIEKHAKDGLVKADIIGDWLIILFDYKDFVGMCYYTTEESEVPDFSFLDELQGKSVMFDVIIRRGNGDTVTSAKLVNAGRAELYKKYLHQTLASDKINFQNFTLADGYRVDWDYNNYEEFYALISEGLDVKSMELPTKEKFTNVCQEKCGVFIVDENGKLAATEILTYNGKTGYPLHLATSSSHRRKGLGMYVMEEVLRLAVKKEIRTLKCWIEQTNVPSLTLCHRLGYQEDGTVCEQYIMKGN